MSGPKIKVSADITSVEEQLAKLKRTIADVNAELSSNKSKLSFEGTQKQLNAMVKAAEQLTKALGDGDQKSKSHLRTLKQIATAMGDAAKVSARAESIGGSSNSHVSGYFRQYSSELSSEASGIALQRDREQTAAHLAQQRQQRNAQFISRASRFAGAVGGSMLGGGGGYASLGAGLGSLLPGPFGMIAGGIGGAIGGFVDRNIGSNKQEALKYSELRRSLGGVTVDFERLRDSVRLASQGFGVTNQEAAGLAKEFAKITGSRSIDDIASSVGASAGFAQGYGIAPGQTTDFFATMRVNGIGKNDQDNKRIALQIGEAVARSGSTAKMDEMLQVISGYVKNSTSQSLTAPNYAEFISTMSSMVGSNIWGLSKNPEAAAGLLAEADAGVRGGGSMGDASRAHWQTARMKAIPGMTGLDDAVFAEAGMSGELAKQIDHDSALWKNSSSAGRTRLDRLHKQIPTGLTNTDIGLDYVRSISSNDLEKNRNLQAMFGIHGIQKAAAFENLFSSKGALDGLEGMLKKRGMSLNRMSNEKISSYAEIFMGSEDDRKAYYNNIKNGFSKEDLAAGEKAFASGGDALKGFLLDQVDKGITDPGLAAQQASVDLQNRMSSSMDKLVGIETMAKDALIDMLKIISPASPTILRDLHDRMNNAQSVSNVDVTGQYVPTDDVSGAIDRIRKAKTKEEKSLIAKSMFHRYDAANGVGFPENTKRMILDALDDSDKKPATQGGEQPTIPQYTGGYKGLSSRQREIVGMVRNKTKYDALFQEAGSKYGLDPLLIEQLASQESGQNPNATNGTDFGMMQHNKRFWSERGINESNWRDPRINVMAGAKFFREKLDQSNGDFQEAFRRYNGAGSGAEYYGRESIGTYNALYDQIPENQRQSAQVQEQKFSHEINVNLKDQQGRPAADPVRVAATISKPVPAGLR